MKVLSLLLFLMPLFSVASTQLHLVDILKRGYHFTPTSYSAFAEGETGIKGGPEEYLKAILKRSEDRIKENHEILQQTNFEVEIVETGVSENETTTTTTNTYNFKQLKECAKSTRGELNEILFHESRGDKELVADLKAKVSLNRGMSSGAAMGLPCGRHMGEFGELLGSFDPMDELKLVSFIAKEEAPQVKRLLKVLKYEMQALNQIEKDLFRYLFSRLILSSFKNTGPDNISFKDVKEEFKAKRLTSHTVILGPDASATLSLEGLREEVEKIYAKVGSDV